MAHREKIANEWLSFEWLKEKTMDSSETLTEKISVITISYVRGECERTTNNMH